MDDLTCLVCFQPPPNPIKPTDDQLSLADIDIVKVVGKGNGGMVQLVQHKWTNQFFALKVLYLLLVEYLACCEFKYSFLSFLSNLCFCIGIVYPHSILVKIIYS
jgi:hypothetical protein